MNELRKNTFEIFQLIYRKYNGTDIYEFDKFQ